MGFRPFVGVWQEIVGLRKRLTAKRSREEAAPKMTDKAKGKMKEPPGL